MNPVEYYALQQRRQDEVLQNILRLIMQRSEGRRQQSQWEQGHELEKRRTAAYEKQNEPRPRQPELLPWGEPITRPEQYYEHLEKESGSKRAPKESLAEYLEKIGQSEETRQRIRKKFQPPVEPKVKKSSEERQLESVITRLRKKQEWAGKIPGGLSGELARQSKYWEPEFDASLRVAQELHSIILSGQPLDAEHKETIKRLYTSTKY